MKSAQPGGLDTVPDLPPSCGPVTPRFLLEPQFPHLEALSSCKVICNNDIVGFKVTEVTSSLTGQFVFTKVHSHPLSEPGTSTRPVSV